MKTIFSEMAQYTSADWWRYTGFVLLNIAMATGGTYYITQSLPPIREESLRMFVLPMGVLSLFLFTGLYPLLRRMNPGIPRFLALYGAFNIALIGLALYFTIPGFLRGAVSETSVGEFMARIGVILMLIVGCGHMYGLVPLLGIAAVNRLFSRLFFPRFATTG